MALTAFKIPALLLVFLSFIFLLTTTASSYWRISSIVNATNWKYEGLWMTCEATSWGFIQCNTLYVPLSSGSKALLLPGKAFLFSSIEVCWLLDVQTVVRSFIQVCRALMIASLVLGICGILLALLSLKCPQLGFSDEKTKRKISMMSGMVFALAGLSSMAAISWYAVNVVTEFFDPFYAGTKYEMGHSLYLGWTGSLLSIIGGILVTCSSCK